MKDSFIINGGKPLKGEVTLSGAKNVALKTIIAALMFDSVVYLENIPRINDVADLIELVKSLGGEAEFVEKNKLKVDGRNLKINEVDLFYGSKIRASFMFFAPLLFRFGQCVVPNPGGCRLGARPIDRIVNGMKAFGVKVDYNSETGYYKARLDTPPKGTYCFEKPSHTGTELLILIGLMTDSEAVIENAAAEPEIDDLIIFLGEAGARIKKEGNKIIVNKSLPLIQKFPFRIISDRNELVTYATLAVATGGDVVVGEISESVISSFLDALKRTGAGVERLEKNRFRFYKDKPIKSISVDTGPHPGFMTDWQPSFAILLLTADGVSTIHERVFENRFSYVEELRKIGGQIDFSQEPVINPKEFYHFNWEDGKEYKQAIKINGGQTLHNGVMNVKDLRAGAALACAALLTPGETVVNGVSNLERGYEDFVGKIIKIGGDIKKI
jgi:UDP-N-acetylglucosamine 1-carboxyvinyltransferase